MGKEKKERTPYDPEKDIVLAEEKLTDKFVARVMRYDGVEDEDEAPVPKLVVFRTGKGGKEYTPKRIPGDAAIALGKAITKFQKAGAFE